MRREEKERKYIRGETTLDLVLVMYSKIPCYDAIAFVWVSITLLLFHIQNSYYNVLTKIDVK